MINMLSLIAFLLTLPLLTLPLLTLAASSGSGSVSLWSDTGCSKYPDPTSSFASLKNPVALNYTPTVDTCGTPGGIVHSYVVNSWPTCANGTIADIAFYNGPDCQVVGFGPALNSRFGPSPYDGLCLSLVEFRSVAFICNGIGTSASGSSSVVVASSSTSVASATPIAPSTKATSPLYTTPASSPTGAAKASGTGTFIGGGGTGTRGASPAVFTGGAGMLGVDAITVLGAAAIVGMVIS